MLTKILNFITGTAVITAFAALFAHAVLGWVKESQNNTPHAPAHLISDVCKHHGYQSDVCKKWKE